MPVTIPHFALPLRFNQGRAAVTQQDSISEITDCVTAIALCPMDFREELPEFGIEDPTFTEASLRLDDITKAISEWEPRAHTLIQQERDTIDELISRVTVAVGQPPPS